MSVEHFPNDQKGEKPEIMILYFIFRLIVLNIYYSKDTVPKILG